MMTGLILSDFVLNLYVEQSNKWRVIFYQAITPVFVV